MTAQDMFEALGWKLGERKDEYLYYQKKQGNAEYDLDFYLDDKTYYAYGYMGDYKIRYMINAQEHLAITQQMKELGWIE